MQISEILKTFSHEFALDFCNLDQIVNILKEKTVVVAYVFSR